MSIVVIQSSRRSIPASSDGYAACCGRPPTVLKWPGRNRKRGDLTFIAVNCSNPDCPNFEQSTFECEAGIHAKWDRYRKQ